VPSVPLVVLAVSPDGEAGVAVGPVYSQEAALKLAREMVAAGWKPGGVRQHMSAGSFRAMVKKEKNGG
jgi:hypothetical protein